MTRKKISLRRLSASSETDRQVLQSSLEAGPGYWLKICGNLPKKSAADEVFAALPERNTSADKFVFGITYARRGIGCVDLVRGYPDASTAMLGLLLLDEVNQRRGFGRASYRELEKFILDWAEIDTVRIGVVATNAEVLPFWKSLGFVDTGIRRPHASGSVESETIVLVKSLDRTRRH